MAAFCGCCYFLQNRWEYLPQVSLNAHATILSSSARTTLTQTFTNPSRDTLKEVSYTFPLYDGVSIVGFKCRVGSRVLQSQVKPKEQANAEYEQAVAQNQTAGILDHSRSASDVFKIRLGNVPAGEKVVVNITFVGELKQDSQTDGIRYTIPNSIAPRYGTPDSSTQDYVSSSNLPAQLQGISITADVLMEKSSVIRELQSPSHPVKVSLGRTSLVSNDASTFEPAQASANLRVEKENAFLERDFILVVKADGLDEPRALLESHPTISGQRAVMATLVPKFGLPPIQPELIFVIDRSGSMSDKIPTLKSALRVFLKSLPVGVCFNICSFGTIYSFLWPSSRVYDASSLQDALNFVDLVAANMGGTNMQEAVEAVVQSRLKDKELEVLLLTDGQIWNQDALFDFVRKTSANHSSRFFSLGMGDAASHSLVEGIARAGNGISQSVINYEELDRKVVRMLKAALTPHIHDYKLEVDYDTDLDQEFEIVASDVETNDSGAEGDDKETPSETLQSEEPKQSISLYDSNYEEVEIGLGKLTLDDKDLPSINSPKEIQAPHKIPPLYPFIRTTVYLLLDSRSSEQVPKSLTFRATSKQGPLVLKIPIHDIGQGETIHQLASRKAVIELEEGHGWLEDAKDNKRTSLKQLHADTKQRIVVRECQRLGTKFQVTGKHCSFVALEENPSQSGEKVESETFTVEEVSGQFGHSVAKGAPPFAGLTSFAAAPPAPPFAASAPFVVPQRRNVQMAACRFSSRAPPPPPPARGQPLFGSTSALGGATPAGSSSGLFGRASQPSFGAPSASSASMFGASPPPARGQPSFGMCSTPAAFSASPFGAPPPPPPASGSSLFGSASASTASPFGLFGQAGASAASAADEFGSSEDDDDDEDDQRTKVHAIINLQTFEGSWEWTNALFNALGLHMDGIKTNLATLLQGTTIAKDEFGVEFLQSDCAKIIATLLVMGCLTNVHAEFNNLWELVFDKAQSWVQQQLPKMGTDGEVLGQHKSDIMGLV